MPGDQRRLNHFLVTESKHEIEPEIEAEMEDQYRGSTYTYDDILGMLCLSYDIRVRDSKITDGKTTRTRIHDILDFLEIKEPVIREDIILFDSLASGEVYDEQTKTQTGAHYFILPLTDFSIKSVEAMKDVKTGKRNYERAKYDIMVSLRDRMGKAVTQALHEKNITLNRERKVTGQRPIQINPPVGIIKREYKAYLPTRIFDNPELISEILAQSFKKEGTAILGSTNKYTISVPINDSAVTMMISMKNGNVQIIIPGKGYDMPEDPEQTVLDAFRQLVEN